MQVGGWLQLGETNTRDWFIVHTAHREANSEHKSFKWEPGQRVKSLHEHGHSEGQVEWQEYGTGSAKSREGDGHAFIHLFALRQFMYMSMLFLQVHHQARALSCSIYRTPTVHDSRWI